jgi:hypothetical protein
MRDPHVESLRYALQPTPEVSYSNPPPVLVVTDEFLIRLDQGTVNVEMKAHHASQEDARRCVEAYLTAWSIDVELRVGRAALVFDFVEALVVDRDPPPPSSSHVLHAKAAVFRAVGGNASLRLTCPAYPAPPARFGATADVLTLWFRFKQYQAAKEPLASMAYFCLTLVEQTAAGTGAGGVRQQAASLYSIDIGVLNAIGNLTAAVGDSWSGRKFTAGPDRRALASDEKHFIEEAIKALIRRKGEYDADPSLPLPALNRSLLPAIDPKWYARL